MIEAVKSSSQVTNFVPYVQERFDDFAWEDDRIAHRIYGPGLELPSAGKDQLTSSGIDLWTKKARYPIVDRAYRKGHDGDKRSAKPFAILVTPPACA